MPVVSAREILVNWIRDTENAATRFRELARHCKNEAQRFEEQAIRLRGMLPPEEPKEEGHVQSRN